LNGECNRVKSHRVGDWLLDSGRISCEMNRDRIEKALGGDRLDVHSGNDFHRP
jgi:hypothetical protein